MLALKLVLNYILARVATYFCIGRTTPASRRPHPQRARGPGLGGHRWLNLRAQPRVTRISAAWCHIQLQQRTSARSSARVSARGFGGAGASSSSSSSSEEEESSRPLTRATASVGCATEPPAPAPPVLPPPPPPPGQRLCTAAIPRPPPPLTFESSKRSRACSLAVGGWCAWCMRQSTVEASRTISSSSALQWAYQEKRVSVTVV